MSFSFSSFLGAVYPPDYPDSDPQGAAYLDSVVFPVLDALSTTDDHVNIMVQPPDDAAIGDTVHAVGADSDLRGYDWYSDYSPGSSPAPSSNGSSFEEPCPDILASSSINHHQMTTFLPDRRALTSYHTPFDESLYGPLQEMSLISTDVPPPSLLPGPTGSPRVDSAHNLCNPQDVSTLDNVAVENGQENGYLYDTDISLLNMPVGNLLGNGFDFLPALESPASAQNSSSSGLVHACSSKEVVQTTRHKLTRGRNKEAIIAARRKRDANHTCKECRKTFTSAARLRDHHSSEHLHLIIPCNACPNSYSHGTSLRRHWREKHPELVFRASSSDV